MKLKIFNYVSAVCFFLSSASLLFIPLLDFDEEFPAYAYFLAGLFWFGLIFGTALQIFLWFKTRKLEIGKSLKKLKLIVAVVFVLSVILCVLVLCFFSDIVYALPINLFVLLLTAEMFFVTKQIEKLQRIQGVHKNDEFY